MSLKLTRLQLEGDTNSLESEPKGPKVPLESDENVTTPWGAVAPELAVSVTMAVQDACPPTKSDVSEAAKQEIVVLVGLSAGVVDTKFAISVPGPLTVMLEPVMAIQEDPVTHSIVQSENE